MYINIIKQYTPQGEILIPLLYLLMFMAQSQISCDASAMGQTRIIRTKS